jgi:transposase
LGIGHSTLGKWVRVFYEEAKVPVQDAELLRENERLRKEKRKRSLDSTVSLA